MLAPLAQHQVRAVLAVLPTVHRPLLVLADNGEQYYLKHVRHQPYELQCEWLCHYLLNLWGISTPEVAILTVPPLVRDNLPLAARAAARHLAGPCFGSRAVPDPLDSSDFIQQGNTSELDLLANADDLLWTALFDAWVSNDDRRASHHNLVLAPEPGPAGSRHRLRCWAIDHAYTFNSISFEQLDHQETYFSFNANLAQAAAAKALIRRWQQRNPLLWVEELKQGYYLRIEKCRQEFSAVCDALPESYALSQAQRTSLFYFLFCQSRLARLWDEFYQSIT